ncbi:MAG: RNA polymerase sigma factor [Thiogranum sp.]|nr:RNA polymerase sigma factor [Thiogranum sp.]
MELIRRLLINRDLIKTIADNRDRLYRVALAWCGDAALADDLVQETMAISLQHHAQVRNPGCMKAWMHSVLSNCWKKHLRQMRPDMDIDDADLASDHDVEAACSEQEIVECVRRAILKLPVGQRQTLTLVDLGGFSYAEVADTLDIPIGTVMSRLYAARQTLQKMLTRIRSSAPDNTRFLRRVK